MQAASHKFSALKFTERGSGVPLVLLHAFPLDSRMWDAQLAGLSDRCRVIAPDFRGFGRSPAGGPFSMESMADDMYELLQGLGALPCILAGVSMGGYVALALVRKYASEVRGLILIDTKAEGDSAEARQGREKMIALARDRGAKAVADQMLPKMLPKDASQDTPFAMQLRGLMESCPTETMQFALAAMRDRRDQTDLLPSIALPTLIIVGEHDGVTPPDVAQTMHNSISKSDLVIIPEAGHISPMEQPAAVNEAIRSFIATL